MFLPLNDKQFEFWRLRRSGILSIDIARLFNISKQAVSKALLNSNSLENRKIIRFDEPSIDEPDGGREFTYMASGWWNQYRNRRLITSIMATLFAVSLFFEGGIKYFEIKYWEKKNCRRLVVQKHQFFTVPDSKGSNLHEPGT